MLGRNGYKAIAQCMRLISYIIDIWGSDCRIRTCILGKLSIYIGSRMLDVCSPELPVMPATIKI